MRLFIDSHLIGHSMHAQVRILALISAVIMSSANALEITDDGRAWNKANPRERQAFANFVERTIGRDGTATGSAANIHDCLRDFYKPPAPAHIIGRPLKEMGAMCAITTR